MKLNKRYLLYFFIILFFASCSSDDSETGDGIVGTWAFQKAVVDELEAKTKTQQEETRILLVEYGKNEFKNVVYRFRANGTGTVEDGDEDVETYDITYTLAGNKLTVKDKNDATGKTAVVFDASSLDYGIIYRNKVNYLNDVRDELRERGQLESDSDIAKASAKISFVKVIKEKE